MHQSRGGQTPVTAWTPAKPAGELPIRNTELAAVPSSRLVLEGATPKRILRNGEPVEAGFRLPLLPGKNRFIVEY